MGIYYANLIKSRKEKRYDKMYGVEFSVLYEMFFKAAKSRLKTVEKRPLSLSFPLQVVITVQLQITALNINLSLAYLQFPGVMSLVSLDYDE